MFSAVKILMLWPMKHIQPVSLFQIFHQNYVPLKFHFLNFLMMYGEVKMVFIGSEEHPTFLLKLRSVGLPVLELVLFPLKETFL